MAATETARLAVLIDADNASASVVKELLEEVANYVTATVKRAYGDWTTQNLVGWKEHLLRHAIQPMQQFAYTQGQQLDRLRLHHRCDGPAVRGQRRRILSGVQ